jgi:hypothetical protein
MGRKTSAPSALPELWWFWLSAETGQGLAASKIHAAGVALSKMAGAASSVVPAVVRVAAQSL